MGFSLDISTDKLAIRQHIAHTILSNCFYQSANFALINSRFKRAM